MQFHRRGVNATIATCNVPRLSNGATRETLNVIRRKFMTAMTYESSHKSSLSAISLRSIQRGPGRNTS